jgi:hypothetical protein
MEEARTGWWTGVREYGREVWRKPENHLLDNRTLVLYNIQVGTLKSAQAERRLQNSP